LATLFLQVHRTYLPNRTDDFAVYCWNQVHELGRGTSEPASQNKASSFDYGTDLSVLGNFEFDLQ